MKKALSLILVAGVASTIAAADARNFGGATAGIGLGMTSTKAESTTGTVAGAANPGQVAVAAILSNKKTDLSAQGFSGGIFAGYAKQFDNHFVAGLEAHASFAKAEAKLVGDKAFEQKETFGVDAQFGRVFENVLPYLSLGWGNTKFKAFNKTKRSNAFVVGLGLKTLLTEHVTLGAEWKYSMYKEVKGTLNSAPLSAPSKIKPRTNDFRIKLAYKW